MNTLTDLLYQAMTDFNSFLLQGSALDLLKDSPGVSVALGVAAIALWVWSTSRLGAYSR